MEMCLCRAIRAEHLSPLWDLQTLKVWGVRKKKNHIGISAKKKKSTAARLWRISVIEPGSNGHFCPRAGRMQNKERTPETAAAIWRHSSKCAARYQLACLVNKRKPRKIKWACFSTIQRSGKWLAKLITVIPLWRRFQNSAGCPGPWPLWANTPHRSCTHLGG